MLIIISLILTRLYPSEQDIVEFKEYINEVTNNKPPFNSNIFILVPKVICEGCIEYYLFTIKNKLKNKDICLISANFHIFQKYKYEFKYVAYDEQNKMKKYKFYPPLLALIKIENNHLKIYSIKNTNENININDFFKN